MHITKQNIELYKKYSPKLAEVLKIKNNDKFYDTYFSKIIAGSEIKDLNDNTFEDWLENRLKPNLIFLNSKDYLNCAIGALKTYGHIAKTHWGTSMARDDCHLWANQIDGYLAEIACKNKLKNDFAIDSKVKWDMGTAEEHMDSDLPSIKKQKDKEFRKPNLTISIKKTKWNGVWHDLGDQYKNSDIYIQVKVNTNTKTLVSFLKKFSFFDEIFKKGIKESIITKSEKEEIDSKIENFPDELFAYVAGFRTVDQNNLKFEHEGVMKKNTFHINSAEGLLTDNDLDKIKEKHDAKKIKFISMEKFTRKLPFFITTTGRLKYKKEDWENFVDKL